jgi:hypothetical protein
MTFIENSIDYAGSYNNAWIFRLKVIPGDVILVEVGEIRRGNAGEKE